MKPSFKRNKYTKRIIFIISVVVFASILLTSIYKAFASSYDSRVIDTDSQFNVGTLTNTSSVGTGSSSVVALNASGYKKQLVFNNTGGALTDYQVLIDESEGAYFKMEESSGAFTDSSGNDNIGTRNGGITSVVGRVGNAGYFHGPASSPDYILFPNSDTYSPKNAITVSTWLKPSVSYQPNIGIITKRYADSADPYNSYMLGTDSSSPASKYMFCLSNGSVGTQTCVTSTSYLSTDWQHVSGIYDGTRLYIYVNGVQENSVLKSGLIGYSSIGLVVGGTRAVDPNSRFGGAIDEVRVYGRALPTSEVLSLVNTNESPLLGSVYSRALQNGNDIRFYDSDGVTPLSYWIENYYGSGQNSKIWVKIPSIGATTTKSIYIHYGNVDLPAASSGTNTFQFFSDATDYSNWSYGTTNTGGDLRFSFTGSYCSTRAVNLTAPWVVEARIRHSNATNSNVYFGIGNGVGTSMPTRWNVQVYRNPPAYPQTWWSYNNGSIGSVFTPFVWDRYYIMKEVSRGSTIYDHYISDTNRSLLGSNLASTYGTGGEVNPSTGISICNGSASWNVNTYITWLFARKYAATEPVLSSVGAELPLAVSTGSWVSSNSSSNVIDLRWNGGWGDTGAGTQAFAVAASDVNSTDKITFKIRVATTISGLADATYYNLGFTEPGVPFVKTKEYFEALGIPTGANRYVQVEADFEQSSGTSPKLDSITLNFRKDNTNPANGSVDPLLGVFKTAAKTEQVLKSSWTNTSGPYVEFTSGSDPESGVQGYCVYLGTTQSSDPLMTKGILGASEQSSDNSGCPYVTYNQYIDISQHLDTALITNTTYYLNIRAKDYQGNMFYSLLTSDYNVFDFKYDNVAPTNPLAISAPQSYQNDVSNVVLYWPVSGDSGPIEVSSGVKGYQYRIGLNGNWYGANHVGTGDCSDVITTGQYTLNPSFDTIQVGENMFYLRTIDNACNVAQVHSTALIKYSGLAPTEPLNLEVQPALNTDNSFAFSWQSPARYNGLESLINYCYSVNTKPSPNTCIWTRNKSLSAEAYATQPGANTMYIVAKDEAGNVNYDAYASVVFTANTAAPSVPLNVDISDISIKISSNWKLAVTWDLPEIVGTGIASYKVYRSTQSSVTCSSSASSFSYIGSTGGTSYSDSGLSQLDYSYCIKACDSANNCSAYSSTVTLHPTGKFTSPAVLVSDPAVNSIGIQKATISWVTNRTSDSRVQYGTESGVYFEEEIGNSDQVTSHSIKLTNLLPGKVYYFISKWTDEDGNLGKSNEMSFATNPSPEAFDVKTTEIGLNYATVTFSVKGAAEVHIKYGKNGSLSSEQTINTSEDLSRYSIRLTDLEDNTKYNYKFVLVDSDGGIYPTLVDFAFTTPPRPRVSNIRVQQVKNTASSTVQVSWVSNTEISSIIKYYPSTSVDQEKTLADLKLIKGEHKVNLSGLSAERTYSMVITGRDVYGNEAVSDVQVFTTALDTRPPAISELVAEGEKVIYSADNSDSGIQMVVSWMTDEPATSQVEFGEGSGTVYPSKTFEDSGLTTEHIVILPNLMPSKVYHLRVISKDKSGNTSVSYDTVVVTPNKSESALDLIFNSLQGLFK